jgi:hypothetical protein
MNKKTILISALAMLSLGRVYASPACVDGASLQAYITATVNNGGCQIGNFQMANWAYVNASVFTTPVTPADIIVNFALNGSGLPDITFTGIWRADVPVGVANSTGLIAFSIEALNNSHIITGVGLHATGSVSPVALSLVPTGAAAVAEIDCVGGLLDLRDPNNALALLPLPGNLGDIGCSGGGLTVGASAALGSGNNVNANANIAFGPGDNFIDVLKLLTASDLISTPPLGLIPGTNGFAQIQSVSQSFQGYANQPSQPDTETPEPSSLLLTGSALLLAHAKRRLWRPEQ